MGLNMMQAFPSKYLSAADVNEQGVVLRISGVTMESVDQDMSKPQKPVVHFQGTDKGMVLNVTNNNTIISMYGADSDGWVGKDVILFKTHVDFQGRMVEAIRVRPGAPQAAQAPIGQPAPQPAIPQQPAPAQPLQAGQALPGYEKGDPLDYDV